jgi:hypothetical protein
MRIISRNKIIKIIIISIIISCIVGHRHKLCPRFQGGSSMQLTLKASPATL